MEKPTKHKRKPMMDYQAVINFIEDKYKIDTRDYLSSHNHFNDWFKKHNLPKTDEEGKTPGLSQIFYKQYKDAEDGEKLRPEYLDYWHWIIDDHFCEVFNGAIDYWGVKDIIKNKENPEWIRNITQHVYDEFKDELDKDGGMEVLIEW